MTMIVDGYTTLGNELTREQLLQQMDSCGVAGAVVGPEDHELAVYNREGNQRLTAESARAPDRLIPACTVTPWRGRQAETILRDAVEAGARLLVLAPAVQGFMMTDDVIDPVLLLAAALDIAVYVHTGPHGMGAPTQTVLAAQKHPETRFILAHGGSTDHAWDMETIVEHHMLDNLWLELSLVRPWVLPRYLQAAGADRVIYGSSAPRTDLAFEVEHFTQYVPLDAHPDFYGTNLLRALGEEA